MVGEGGEDTATILPSSSARSEPSLSAEGTLIDDPFSSTEPSTTSINNLILIKEIFMEDEKSETLVDGIVSDDMYCDFFASMKSFLLNIYSAYKFKV